MRRVLTLLVLALPLASCPRSKREVPADPPGMERVAGGSLSVPKPKGFVPIESTPPTAGVAARGGVSLVRREQGGSASSIVVDVGETSTTRWSKSECATVSQGVAKRRGGAAREAEVVELPTGKTCHFFTDGKDGRPTEFFYVAGKPPYIVACLGKAPDLAEHCRHVASWIRPKH